MLIRLLPVLAALLSVVFADVKVTTPASGAKVSLSGGGITVKWGEGSGDVALADLSAYQIFLMAGGSTDDTSGQVGLVAGTMGAASSKTVTLTAAQGPAGANAYYIKFVSTKSDGSGQVINYSNRFTINGMTGAFPGSASGQSSAQVQAAYQKVASDPTAVPDDTTEDTSTPSGAATGDVSDYLMQTTGTIKYAPMQGQPGSTITAKGTKPLYASFTHPLATTYMSLPSFVITQTVARTVSTHSRENTGTAAPKPTDDMAKYLARWKD